MAYNLIWELLHYRKKVLKKYVHAYKETLSLLSKKGIDYNSILRIIINAK